MFRGLKAARLDHSVEAEMRWLARVELLILDDFALKAMDQIETADFYELIVERHQKAATIVTSNRDPAEWIALMSDPLLAQSAVDRLVAPATNSSSKESPTAAGNDPNRPPTVGPMVRGTPCHVTRGLACRGKVAELAHNLHHRARHTVGVAAVGEISRPAGVDLGQRSLEFLERPAH
jgi:hypothetical protein